MQINLYTKPITVFLAASSSDVLELRTEMKYVLAKAGITAVDGLDGVSDADLSSTIAKCDCSVHLLGLADIYTSESKDYDSDAGVQFRCAKQLCGNNFKMFVWNPSGIIDSNNKYINNIRRDIVENIVYSDKPSPIYFVEDIRNILNVKQSETRHHEPSDIFFIYNELDSDTADGIYNMLKDFQKVNRLAISLSSEVDYSTYITEQIADSTIGVIYYNYAGDWAISFARQIWKDTGGNSSSTPLFVAANQDHATNEQLSVFKDIIKYVIDDKLRLPLDIKLFLDNNNNRK